MHEISGYRWQFRFSVILCSTTGGVTAFILKMAEEAHYSEDQQRGDATGKEVIDIDDLNKAELVANVAAAVIEKQWLPVATMTATAIQKLFDAKKMEINEHVQLEVQRKRKDEPTFTKQGTKEQFKHQRELLDNLEMLNDK